MKRLTTLLFVLSLNAQAAGPEVVSEKEILKTSLGDLQLEVLLKNLDVIWGFDFLPTSGDVVVTERVGRMKIYRPATRTLDEVKGLPAIKNRGQGGLLDVRVHPEFTRNALIFFTYAEERKNGEMTTALGRAELRGSELKNFKRLIAVEAWTDEDIHFGSRIEFDGPNQLWITVGDRNERKDVQNLERHNGKILRVDLDGKPVSDNPFVKNSKARPEIYSLGHRSPQGLARDPVSGHLWLAEMGPRGGDEINLIVAGQNYGWPDVTYGREYWGPSIGEKSKAGTVQPVKYWVPSISPSGLMVYSGAAFPQWQGHLIVGNLSGQHLRRLGVKGVKITDEESWLKNKAWRFRSLRTGPKGEIYFGTDEGRLARLQPVPKA
jgi:glucose/arabinose dehydrogenase